MTSSTPKIQIQHHTSIYGVSVTRFFQQSLPKFCSNFTKLRKILPNVGFPNNYVIIMAKNNSCIFKDISRKIMHKNVSRNTCCFHHIAVFANYKALFCGLIAVLLTIHHTLSTLLNKKHTFLP